jgi:mono/diheme cytochrome c family protein
MNRAARAIAIVCGAAGVVAAGAAGYVGVTGLSARPQPSHLETTIARAVRRLAVPRTVKRLPNPVPATPAAVLEGRAHFADHCASCHGNDGGGDTEMGRNLYPKAPDMRLPRTQQLSDGELFNIIENGVKLTGMPAWTTGTPEGEKASWELVHFIRRMPKLTADDLAAMAAANPTSRSQIEQEKREQDFLNGGEPPPAPDPHAEHKHPQ